MTKIVCDICGKEMSTEKKDALRFKDLDFCISSFGKMWDVCDECREEIKLWINRHKYKSDVLESEDKDE